MNPVRGPLPTLVPAKGSDDIPDIGRHPAAGEREMGPEGPSFIRRRRTGPACARAD
jgi:hypothetical protein